MWHLSSHANAHYLTLHISIQKRRLRKSYPILTLIIQSPEPATRRAAANTSGAATRRTRMCPSLQYQTLRLRAALVTQSVQISIRSSDELATHRVAANISGAATRTKTYLSLLCCAIHPRQLKKLRSTQKLTPPLHELVTHKAAANISGAATRRSANSSCRKPHQALVFAPRTMST